MEHVKTWRLNTEGRRPDDQRRGTWCRRQSGGWPVGAGSGDGLADSQTSGNVVAGVGLTDGQTSSDEETGAGDGLADAQTSGEDMGPLPLAEQGLAQLEAVALEAVANTFNHICQRLSLETFKRRPGDPSPSESEWEWGYIG